MGKKASGFTTRMGIWSTSRHLLAAPGQYGRAFLDTETDGNDLTYFIVHQIQVIQRSLDAFEDYAKRKVAATRAIRRCAAPSRRVR